MRALADESRAELEVKLAALEGEVGVGRAREAATARILQAIAAGPQEAARALDLIAESATMLCGAYDAVVLLRQEGQFVRGGHYGPIPMDLRGFPLSRRSTSGRCVLERRPIHVHDLLAAADEFPDSADMARRFGHRTILSVPLLRGDEAIGSIALRRFEVNPFGEDDIALLATFADQAVIAVESTRVSRELNESLRQQAATAEVLEAISQPAFDLQRVFEVVGENALALCGADKAFIFRFDGEMMRSVVAKNASPELLDFVAKNPIRPGRHTATARAALLRQTVYIEDVLVDPDFSYGAREIDPLRTTLSVPILKGDALLGVITIYRLEVKPFTRNQIALIETFADQAAIAIQSIRLLTDLREALQQQTATADVLKAIAGSAFDLDAVLYTLVESALALCRASGGNIHLRDGDVFRPAMQVGWPPEFLELMKRNPIRPEMGSVSGRAVMTASVVRIPDVLADPLYALSAGQKIAGYRSVLGVPLIRDGDVTGVFSLGRDEVDPFTDREAELVQMFSDQAVIAIENARLFTELEASNRVLSEALEQQTATSAILRVIASSPADLAPVLSVVAENAARLCGAADAQIFSVRGEVLQLEASFGSIPIHFRKQKIGRDWVTGRAVVDRRTVHVHDLAAEADHEFPIGREMQRAHGHRTTLATPLLKQGSVLGAILIRRMEVQPFSDGQIRLLETFADQAAIAIENARLFEALQARTGEVQEALEQQTATSEILRAISTSMTDAQPVFDAIVRSAVSLCGSLFANVFRYDGEQLHFVASHNVGSGYVDLLRRKYPMRPDPSQVSGRVIIGKALVGLEDALADPDYDQTFPAALAWRRMLGVPMLRYGMPIGAIVVGWAEPGSISGRQQELLKTFADQAVIAIENARLFGEVEGRTRELQEALDYQTATTKILQVIGCSPSDAQPVFDAIVEAGRQLFPGAAVSIALPEGDRVVAAAVAEDDPERAAAWRGVFGFPLTREYMHSRAILDGTVIDIPDASEAPEDLAVGARNFLRSGYRAVTIVPMFRGDRAIGALSVVRVAAGALDSKQRDLVSTFASQAVIAIENARLFEALESAVAEFNAVLDNIDYGVLFMDKDLRTRIVNPALRRLWNIPQELIDRRPTMRELLEHNRHRGVYTTPPEEWDDWVAARVDRVRQGNVPPGEFVRADGKVYSYQCVALPDGGRMLSYFDISELKNRQAELLAAKEAAEAALAELRTAQERLVQSEKLASLGQLTAGIAHEIKNPLNFVNNFAALSRDLLAELEAVLTAPIAALETAERDDAEDLLRTVRENLEKIAHHGKRADTIVKNMLLHARHGSGEWRRADINAIAEEALNLAYHGARAGHPDFNVEIVKHLDPDAGAIECCPQDIMRVVLNLVSNGIYAANQKRPSAPAGFVPKIDLATRAEGAGIAIEVRDNGTGIPAEIRDSIFLPFFTTKPAGEGTGLGLSLSHDIVVKQHGGSFSVESEPGAFTCFRVVLPRHAATRERAGA